MQSPSHRSPLAAPNQTLEAHTSRMLAELRHNWIPLEEIPIPNLSDAQYRQIFELMLVTHDVGKCSPFFQERMQTSRSRATPKSYHTATSGILGFLAVYTFLTAVNCERAGFWARIICFAIENHHRAQLSPWHEGIQARQHLLTSDLELAHAEEANLNAIAATSLFDNLSLSVLQRTVLEKSQMSIRKLQDANVPATTLYNAVFPFPRNGSPEFPVETRIYFAGLHFASLLFDLDVWEASTGRGNVPQIDFTLPITPLSSDRITQYIEDQRQTSRNEDDHIAQARDHLREAALAAGRTATPGLYTLTAPTGTGKTLAALAFAAEYQQRMLRETDVCPRIIYSLPYIAICDQVERLLHDLGLTNEEMFVHHSLAETRTQEAAESTTHYLSTDYSGWCRSMIVTTLWRLAETLFQHRKSAVQRFHRLARSIIIIDECQVIPNKYLALFRTTLNALAHYFGCVVLLTTATMPSYFHDIAEEIAPEFPSLPNRYCLHLRTHHTDVLTEEEFVAFCNTRITPLASDESLLITCNTRRRAQFLYKKLARDNSTQCLFAHLSTTMTPSHRKQVLLKVESTIESQNLPVVLVSTQCIEAGVDISFTRIIRENAPIPNLVQIAGRCNRHNQNAPGIVEVVRVHPNSSIYENRDMSITFETFRESDGEINESELSKYFTLFDTIQTEQMNAVIVSELGHLEYSLIASNFCLIEERPWEVFVLIESEESQEIINIARETMQLNSTMRPYGVNISKNDAMNHNLEKIQGRAEEFYIARAYESYQSDIGFVLD